MNSTVEQEVARALRSLVREPIETSALAEQVERRYRRRRTTAAGGLAGALAVAILAAVLLPGVAFPWTSQEQNAPAARAATSDPAVAIQQGRFVRTLVLDGGALRVDPPPRGEPTTAEQEAVTTFRSTGAPTQVVNDVLVGYGVVTIRPTLLGKLNAGLVFDRRPAWLVFYTARHECPLIPVPLPSGWSELPEGRRVFVLGDSGVEAVTYVGRGSFCARPPTGPDAELAYRHISVPWLEVGRAGDNATLRYQPPRCGPAEAVSVGERSGPGSPLTVTLYTQEPMAAYSCPQPSARTIEVPTNGLSLRHGATGPVTGLVTDPRPPPRFDYSRG